MKIILCGSITAAAEIEAAQKSLEAVGHIVEVPLGVTDATLRLRTEVRMEEKSKDKREHDVLRRYFQKIQDADAVLIVNPEKRSIPGYIGGNTLIEMAFAHVLFKRLYVLYSLPELAYTAEMCAMQPLIIAGDLLKIV